MRRAASPVADDEDRRRMNRRTADPSTVSDAFPKPERTRQQGGEGHEQHAGDVRSVDALAAAQQPHPAAEGAEDDGVFGVFLG